jgi:hypothetical protein
MTIAVVSTDEEQRLGALRPLEVLDMAPDASYEQVARLVAELLDVPIVLVGLLDRDRLWFKAKFGTDLSETGREGAFCADAVAFDGDGPLIITDAQSDPRFASSPLVTGEAGVRFYAGQPLRAPDGDRVGTLCLIDRVPRDLDDRGRDLLRGFAVVIERLFAHRAIEVQRAGRGTETTPTRTTPTRTTPTRTTPTRTTPSAAGHPVDTTEAKLILRLERFGDSLIDATAVIERERGFINGVVEELKAGRTFRFIVEEIGGAGRTQQLSLTQTLSQMEEARRSARIEMFRELTRDGYTVADVARLWGVSRQLVSRTMHG